MQKRPETWSELAYADNQPQAYFSNTNHGLTQNQPGFFGQSNQNYNGYPTQPEPRRDYTQSAMQRAIQTGIADDDGFPPRETLQQHYGGPPSSQGWGNSNAFQSPPPQRFPGAVPSGSAPNYQQPRQSLTGLNAPTSQVVTIQPGLTDQQATIKYHLPKSNNNQEILGNETPAFSSNNWESRSPSSSRMNMDFQDFDTSFGDSLDRSFGTPERLPFSEERFAGDRLFSSDPERHSFSHPDRLPFGAERQSFSSPPMSPFSPPMSPPFATTRQSIRDDWYPPGQQPMSIDQSPRNGRSPMSPPEEIQPPSRATAPTTSSNGKKRTKKLASSAEQPSVKSRRTSSASKSNRQQSLLVFSGDGFEDRHAGKHKLTYDTPTKQEDETMVDQKALKPIPFPPMDPTPREVRQLSMRSQKEEIAKYRALVENIDADVRGLGKEIERTNEIGLSADRASYLVQYTAVLLTRTAEAIAVVYDLPEYNLLEAPEIPLVEGCLQNLRRCRTQLLIYERELQCFANGTPFDPPAVLFVQCVPFPSTIQQFHPCDTEVRLLTGACTIVRALSPVKAEICNSTFSQKRGQGMKGAEAQLDPYNIAKFSQLTFTLGTGCKTVQLKFTVELQYPQSYGVGSVILSTPPTETFLVTTHTRQWAAAEGEALKRELFMARTATGEPVAQENWDDAWRWSVPQEYFCNCVQKHYLQATRQEPNAVVRALHPDEMLFIMKKFDEKERKRNALGEFIDNKEFDQFWDWFGIVLQKIRHQHFLLPMWTQGLFWGFLSKAQSEQVLDKQDIGVFLLRFSESSPGTIAVSYKQSPVLVRHYLFKGCDPGQKGPSLPQFIRETNSLKTFLLIRIPLEFGQERKLFLIEKHNALQKIGVPKKKPPTTGPPTYDPQIEDLQQAIDNLVISSPENTY